MDKVIWYNLADVHRELGLRQGLIAYASRVTTELPASVRKRTRPSGGSVGRPGVDTYIDQTGLAVLMSRVAAPPTVAPAHVPKRLADAARHYFVPGRQMTTRGLTDPAQTISPEEFIHRFQYVDELAHLFEDDFDKL